MTTIDSQMKMRFRMDAYPVDRAKIVAQPSITGAMDLALSLCNFASGKEAARKLGIDPGAYSCKKDGTKPWAVDEVRRVMEAGQNLIPLAWLAGQYGHGLVMLETEAERRERGLVAEIERLRNNNRVLTDAISGRTA